MIRHARLLPVRGPLADQRVRSPSTGKGGGNPSKTGLTVRPSTNPCELSIRWDAPLLGWAAAWSSTTLRIALLTVTLFLRSVWTQHGCNLDPRTEGLGLAP